MKILVLYTQVIAKLKYLRSMLVPLRFLVKAGLSSKGLFIAAICSRVVFKVVEIESELSTTAEAILSLPLIVLVSNLLLDIVSEKLIAVTTLNPYLGSTKAVCFSVF